MTRTQMRMRRQKLEYELKAARQAFERAELKLVELTMKCKHPVVQRRSKEVAGARCPDRARPLPELGYGSEPYCPDCGASGMLEIHEAH